MVDYEHVQETVSERWKIKRKNSAKCSVSAASVSKTIIPPFLVNKFVASSGKSSSHRRDY